mmetsp:Transcript_4001/g.12541  ORF Transcript_4001/g.12541 Transcript_4001/m.12541 type:complete len:451 (-) Transcript_4001:205-1557(-)
MRQANAAPPTASTSSACCARASTAAVWAFSPSTPKISVLLSAPITNNNRTASPNKGLCSLNAGSASSAALFVARDTLNTSTRSPISRTVATTATSKPHITNAAPRFSSIVLNLSTSSTLNMSSLPARPSTFSASNPMPSFIPSSSTSLSLGRNSKSTVAPTARLPSRTAAARTASNHQARASSPYDVSFISTRPISASPNSFRAAEALGCPESGATYGKSLIFLLSRVAFASAAAHARPTALQDAAISLRKSLSSPPRTKKRMHARVCATKGDSEEGSTARPPVPSNTQIAINSKSRCLSTVSVSNALTLCSVPLMARVCISISFSSSPSTPITPQNSSNSGGASVPPSTISSLTGGCPCSRRLLPPSASALASVHTCAICAIEGLEERPSVKSTLFTHSPTSTPGRTSLNSARFIFTTFLASTHNKKGVRSGAGRSDPGECVAARRVSP